jgi:hypothetical protein
MRAAFVAASLAVLASASFGCAIHRYPLSGSPASSVVTTADARIADKIFVDRLHRSSGPDGRLEASLTLRSALPQKATLRVRFRFAGAEGVVLEDSPWTPLPIESAGIETVKAVSLSRSARDVRVEVEFSSD